MLQLIFFLSGLSALLFENLWWRQCGLVFGNSVVATAIVLSSFMAGLSLGNGLAARFGDRIARPIRAYALLEAAIGAAGLALVVGLPGLGAALAPVLRGLVDAPALDAAARLAIAFTLLLVPSTAMGLTLPLLVRARFGPEHGFGSVIGQLYGVNTLGAVVGVLLPELLLIESLGVRGAAMLGASVNAIVVVAALSLSSLAATETPGPAGAPDDLPAEKVATGRVARLLAAAALAGGLLMALEVVWFRMLLLTINGTSRAFALMLAVVLCGIALGSVLSGLAERRWPEVHRHASSVAAFGGVLVVMTYASFEWFLPEGLGRVSSASETIVHSVALMGPTSLVSGFLFPLLGRALHDPHGGAARTTGLLTMANTAGAALGPLVAGFALLPRLGMERSFFLIAVAYGGIALLALAPGAARARRIAGASGIALLVALAAFPHGLMEEGYLEVVRQRFGKGSERVVAQREGLTETIHYSRFEFLGEPLAHRLITNGYSMAGRFLVGGRYMALFAHLPLALLDTPRDALLISYGAGTTARALADSPELESVHVVDISRDVLEMNDVVFPDPARHPLRDPRFQVHVEDGRHFLTTTDLRFDLITGEPPPLKISGVPYLYTREYFELARSRLRPGGLMSYWLPVYQLSPPEFEAVSAAFCAAFRDCSLWTGNGLEWILLGSRDLPMPVAQSTLERIWEQPKVADLLDEIGVETPGQLMALFVADAKTLPRQAPPLDDDHPLRIGQRVWGHGSFGGYFPSFMSARKSRERFQGSAYMRRLLTPEAFAAGLDAYRFQETLNVYFGVKRQPPGVVLASLDRTLDEPGYRSLALWLMGAERKTVEIARKTARSEETAVEIDFQLGAAALVDGNEATAAERFERAAASGHVRAIRFGLLAHARAGQLEAARALGRRHHAEPDSPDPSTRAWLRSRFDLDW